MAGAIFIFECCTGQHFPFRPLRDAVNKTQVFCSAHKGWTQWQTRRRTSWCWGVYNSKILVTGSAIICRKPVMMF